MTRPEPTMAMQGIEMAWMLVYNVGQPDEGVYTHTQPGQATAALAFESMDDADAFVKQMMAASFEVATPLCWGADELARFTHTTGMEVTIVPRGNLPPLPQTFDRSAQGYEEAERAHSWRGDPRPDPYTAYRLRLEAIFPRKPDNCGDDDCTLPEVEPASIRAEAMEAIDAVLGTHGDEIDLPTLMKSAWEKAEADKPREPAEDDEA